MSARPLRRHLSYANVMATVAVFVALGGSSYAALTLPRNSVGAKQIKANAVTTKKVKRGSLLASDFKASQRAALRGRQGPAGPQGLTGERGPQGEAGAAGGALAYAEVSGPGVIYAPHAKGITTANVTNPSPGEYCFSGLDFTPRNVQATTNAESINPAEEPAVHATIGAALSNCADAQFTVVTAQNGAFANDGFTVAVN